VRVTRLRADLPVRHLATDLELEADLDQSLIPVNHNLSRQVGAEKLCPYGVASVTVATNSLALSTTERPANANGADCAIGDKPSRASVPMMFFGALAVCALARKLATRR